MPNNNTNIAINRLDDFSSFLGLIAIILSIQSSIISRKENSQNQVFADKVITVSVFIAACASFVDLETAKIAYDSLINSKEKVSKRQIKAAEDLLTSRIFSVIAVIYLIRATLEATGEEVTTAASAPTPAGIL